MRESTPSEKPEAADSATMLKLLRQNPGKSEAEIAAIMQQTV